ncbi:MAG TPA: hypothetical protein VFZ65_01060 [Planctomycetota bacterium]|nr:hypothetical protein [Planctomycetota bacterium]
MQALRLSLLLLAHVGPLMAQQTLLVGAGQPFATIPPAIAAAQPGDTVLVLGGTHSQTLDIDKGIRLIGRNAHMHFSVFPTTPAITVHDVPVGQTVAIRGFDVVPGGLTSTAQLVVRDCPGPVALRDLSGGNGQLWGIGALRAAQLHIASCFVYGVSATDSQVVCEQCLMEPAALSAVSVTNSSMTLVRCTVPGGNVAFGGPGATLNSGTLVATRTEIRGNLGYAAIATVAGSIVLDPSTVLVPSGSSPAITGPVVPTITELASSVANTNGQLLTIDSHGGAGTLFATLVSLAAPQVATPIGPTWLDPNTAAVFYFATYDPVNRSHSITIPHPVLPAGIVFTVQAVHFAAVAPAFAMPSLVATP